MFHLELHSGARARAAALVSRELRNRGLSLFLLPSVSALPPLHFLQDTGHPGRPFKPLHSRATARSTARHTKKKKHGAGMGPEPNLTNGPRTCSGSMGMQVQVQVQPRAMHAQPAAMTTVLTRH